MPFLHAAALALALAALGGTAASAQQTADELPLPERMDRALREMMEEMRPAIDEMLDALRGFGEIGDPRHYEMPELLPNGDIIIRRREDAPPFRPEEPQRDEGQPPRVDPDMGIRT